jgi:hypothetical protein
MVLSALIIPVWLWISTTHRSHWSVAIEGDYWINFVVPWGARSWCAIILAAAVGWVAGSAPESPIESRGPLQGLALGVSAAAAVLLGVIPSWSWMADLGLTTIALSVEMLVVTMGPVIAGVVTAGLLTIYVNEHAGWSGGFSVGGLALWGLWGTLL